MATCSISFTDTKGIIHAVSEWRTAWQAPQTRGYREVSESYYGRLQYANMSPAPVLMVHWPAFLEYQIQGWILHKNLLVLFCSTFQGKHDLLDLHICTAKKRSKLITLLVMNTVQVLNRVDTRILIMRRGCSKVDK